MAELHPIGPEDLSGLTEPGLEALLLENRFPGDTRNAARLIAGVLAGREWVRAECAQREMPLVPPRVALVEGRETEEEDYIPAVAYDPIDNTILVEWRNLTYDSRKSPHEIVAERDGESGPVIFQGRVSDSYFLGGVEETDHARFAQAHDAAGALEALPSVTMQEYDAQPHELESLEARLRAAEDSRLPAYTREVLQNRIAMAKLFRRR